MSSPTDLSSLKEIILGLFPFLARFRTRPIGEGGALEVKSAAGRTEVEGGDAPAARKGDGTGYLYAQLGAGTPPPVIALWWSPTPPPNASWTAIAAFAPVPIATTPGTPIIITTGSGKVFLG